MQKNTHCFPISFKTIRAQKYIFLIRKHLINKRLQTLFNNRFLVIKKVFLSRFSNIVLRKRCETSITACHNHQL